MMDVGGAAEMESVTLRIEFKLNLDTPDLYHRQKIIDTVQGLWFVNDVEVIEE